MAKKKKRRQRLSYGQQEALAAAGRRTLPNAVPEPSGKGPGMGTGLVKTVGRAPKPVTGGLKKAGKPLTGAEKKALRVLKKPETAATSLTPESRKALIKPSPALQIRISATPKLGTTHKKLQSLLKSQEEPPKKPRQRLPEKPLYEKDLRKVQELQYEMAKPKPLSLAEEAQGVLEAPTAIPKIAHGFAEEGRLAGRVGQALGTGTWHLSGAPIAIAAAQGDRAAMERAKAQQAHAAKTLAEGISPLTVTKAIKGEPITKEDIALDALFFAPWGFITKGAVGARMAARAAQRGATERGLIERMEIAQGLRKMEGHAPLPISERVMPPPPVSRGPLHPEEAQRFKALLAEASFQERELARGSKQLPAVPGRDTMRAVPRAARGGAPEGEGIRPDKYLSEDERDMVASILAKHRGLSPDDEIVDEHLRHVSDTGSTHMVQIFTNEEPSTFGVDAIEDIPVISKLIEKYHGTPARYEFGPEVEQFIESRGGDMSGMNRVAQVHFENADDAHAFLKGSDNLGLIADYHHINPATEGDIPDTLGDWIKIMRGPWVQGSHKEYGDAVAADLEQLARRNPALGKVNEKIRDLRGRPTDEQLGQIASGDLSDEAAADLGLARYDWDTGNLPPLPKGKTYLGDLKPGDRFRAPDSTGKPPPDDTIYRIVGESELRPGFYDVETLSGKHHKFYQDRAAKGIEHIHSKTAPVIPVEEARGAGANYIGVSAEGNPVHVGDQVSWRGKVYEATRQGIAGKSWNEVGVVNVRLISPNASLRDPAVRDLVRDAIIDLDTLFKNNPDDFAGMWVDGMVRQLEHAPQGDEIETLGQLLADIRKLTNAKQAGPFFTHLQDDLIRLFQPTERIRLPDAELKSLAKGEGRRVLVAPASKAEKYALGSTKEGIVEASIPEDLKLMNADTRLDAENGLLAKILVQSVKDVTRAISKTESRGVLTYWKQHYANWFGSPEDLQKWANLDTLSGVLDDLFAEEAQAGLGYRFTKFKAQIQQGVFARLERMGYAGITRVNQGQEQAFIFDDDLYKALAAGEDIAPRANTSMKGFEAAYVGEARLPKVAPKPEPKAEPELPPLTTGKIEPPKILPLVKAPKMSVRRDELGYTPHSWNPRTLQNNTVWDPNEEFIYVSAAVDTKTGKVYMSPRDHTEVADDLAGTGMPVEDAWFETDRMKQYTIVANRKGEVLSVNPTREAAPGKNLEAKIKKMAEAKFAEGIKAGENVPHMVTVDRPYNRPFTQSEIRALTKSVKLKSAKIKVTDDAFTVVLPNAGAAARAAKAMQKVSDRRDLSMVVIDPSPLPPLSGGAPTWAERLKWRSEGKLGLPEITKGLRQKYFPKPGPSRTPQQVDRHLEEARALAVEKGAVPSPPKLGELTKKEKEVQKLEAAINATAPRGLTGYEAVGAKLDVEQQAAKASQRLEEIQLGEHGQRVKANIMDVLNFPRSIEASFDLSAPARQVFLMAMARPKMWLGGFPKMFREFASEDVYKGTKAFIEADEDYALSRLAGVQYTELGAARGTALREERFPSGFAEKVPGVRPSNRAYVGYINGRRLTYFKLLVREAAAAGWDITDKKTLESLGRWVNVSTGRGELGLLKNHADFLNTFFFAPRLFMSRFNVLNPLFYMRLHRAARKEALRTAWHTLAFAGLILRMAHEAGAEVGLDPRSANFAKIKIGNTRIDLFGGLQQEFRFLATVLTGQQVSSTTGRTMTLSGGYGKSSPADVILRFIRSKASPVTGLGWDIAARSDFGGRPLRWDTELANKMTPLLAQDAWDLSREHGGLGTAGGWAGFAAGYGLGVFGIGEQTYGPKKVNVKAEIKKLQKDSIDYGLGMPPQEAIDEVQWKARLHDSLAQGMTPFERLQAVAEVYDEKNGTNFTGTVVPKVVTQGEAEVTYEYIRKALYPTLSEWESAIRTQKKNLANEQLVHSSKGRRNQAGGEDPAYLAKLVGQMRLYQDRTGEPVQDHHISRLKTDQEMVAQRDQFLGQYAQERGYQDYPSLESKSRLVATIRFLTQHKYLDPGTARALTQQANDIEDPQQMDELTTELWDQAGIGEASDQWDSTMGQIQPLSV